MQGKNPLVSRVPSWKRVTGNVPGYSVAPEQEAYPAGQAKNLLRWPESGWFPLARCGLPDDSLLGLLTVGVSFVFQERAEFREGLAL